MMLGKLAYLGSFNLKSVLITAGKLTSMFSMPPSTSLLTFTILSTISILLANVACGQFNRAATIWLVAFISSSMACFPKIIKSTFSFLATDEIIFAILSGSKVSFTSTKMPESAPMASAFLIVSCT